jgi:Zn-dependent metalloprotease
VRVAAPALGFAPAEVPEFDPDPHVKETSTGGRVVNLQQKYHGIPIFQMERTVTFDNTGVIQNVSGASVGDLGIDLETLPSVSVEDAATAAANYLASPSERRDAWTKQIVPEPAIDVKNYQPRVLGKT